MYGILIREGKGGGGKNIGDYIQSIAQRQFIRDKETCYVEIEELSDFKSEQQVNVIMNGWFTWDCTKFLPPACINPFFISFHLTPPQERAFFTPEITAYLKKYQPIGARDIKTMEMMQAHGVDSYFSGCLTMTLGKEYLQKGEHTGDVYIVDPYYEIGGDMSLPHIVRYWKMIWYTLIHLKAAWKLKDKLVRTRHSILRHISDKLDKVVCAANFYHIYSQRFDDDILFGAKYFSAIVDSELSNEEKFAIADKMLKDYAQAKLVITGRLHVSFPCLAVGTKNIFIIPCSKNEKMSPRKHCHSRIMGLEDTVNVMELEDGKLVDPVSKFPSKISITNFPENKNGYLKYSELLTRKVDDFVLNNQ